MTEQKFIERTESVYRCAQCHHEFQSHSMVGRRGGKPNVGIKCVVKGCMCVIRLPTERYDYVVKDCAHANTEVSLIYGISQPYVKSNHVVCSDCRRVLRKVA
jgi:uncharacterized CHY-type Zn-finger protein